MEAPSPTKCRLCGEPSAAYGPEGFVETSYLSYEPEVHAEVGRVLCGRHADEFERWVKRCTNANNRLGEPPRVLHEHLSGWLSDVIEKLAKLRRSGMPIRRCEVIYSHETSGWQGERCPRFASKQWQRHYVCGNHHGHLVKPRTKMAFRFDCVETETAKRLDQKIADMVSELLT